MQSPSSLLASTRPQAALDGWEQNGGRGRVPPSVTINLNDLAGSDDPGTATPLQENVGDGLAGASLSPHVSVIMISGGTGGNCFATPTKNCMHVLPISDDGGSSSEILRCLGGPSVGDIRSRLIRLIPLEGNTNPLSDPSALKAIHNLLAHRFPKDCTEKISREMWADVVEGRSPLWRGIPIDRRECIRAVLVHFHSLILKRTHKKFSFRNFSIGNGFLAGARELLGGLPSAIFMFQALTDSQHIAPVIPVILTTQALTIAAELNNGTKIIGQSEISHPPPQQSVPSSQKQSPAPFNRRRRDSNAFDTAESVPSSSDEGSDNEHALVDSRRGSVASSLSEEDYGVTRSPHGSPWNDNVLTDRMMRRRSSKGLKPIKIERSVRGTLSQDDQEDEDALVDFNALYVKGEQTVPLESPIKRVYYVNNYAAEIFPEPNPTFLEQLQERKVLIYSAGSLWTSLVPCIALRGVATAIARSRSLRARVLLLNSMNDRETEGYNARDYIEVIVTMLNTADKPRRHHGEGSGSGRRRSFYHARDLVSHLVYLEAGEVPINPAEIAELGIEVIKVPASAGKWFSNESVRWALAQISWSL